MASETDDLVALVCSNANNTSDVNLSFLNEADPRETEEESLEELLKRAEESCKDAESHINRTRLAEETITPQISIINQLVSESFVTSTLNEAQAVLDSLHAEQNNVPLSGSIASSSNTPIEIDSDDDVVFVQNRDNTNIIAVVDLCSPPPLSTGRQYANNENTKISASASSSIIVSQPNFDGQRAPNQNSVLETRGPNENSVLCPVCMESSVGRQPHTTKCGHIFCGSCIRETIKTLKKCPLCNKGLTLKMIHPVYI